jgi:hypothetical protein
MPAFDLALGHGVERYSAGMLRILAAQKNLELFAKIGRSIVG